MFDLINYCLFTDVLFSLIILLNEYTPNRSNNSKLGVYVALKAISSSKNAIPLLSVTYSLTWHSFPFPLIQDTQV